MGENNNVLGGFLFEKLSRGWWHKSQKAVHNEITNAKENVLINPLKKSGVASEAWKTSALAWSKPLLEKRTA